MGMLRSFVAFIGRTLLSVIFILSAIAQFIDWQGTTQYFDQGLTDFLALSLGNATLQGGIEWSIAHASFLLLAGVIFELVGGLLVFLGLWTRLGALLLLLFIIPTTLLFHHFWLLQGPDRQMQMIQFMKNLSIAGALLFLLAVGKGGSACGGQKNKPDK
jgi:putative oxidoreductase